MTTALAQMNVNDQVKTLSKFIPDGEVSKQTYLDLVKTQIMGTDSKGNPRPIEDLAYFLRVAHKAGLDPIAKQIHVVYRWDSKLGREKMAIQTGIDGFRLTAQRSKEYVGQDDVVYDDEDGENPKWAKVTVWRFNKSLGERVPYTATARWKEYVATGKDGKPMTMWAKMPYLMLGKVAEALALRKAFPQELSGLYTEDEMAQSNYEKPTSDLPTPAHVSIKKEKQKDHRPEVEKMVQDAEVIQDAVIEEPEYIPVPEDDEITTIKNGEAVYKGGKAAQKLDEAISKTKE
jgi:phage recombination protein Bet